MTKKGTKLVAFLLALAMVVISIMPTNAYAKTKVQYVTRAYVLQQVEKLIGATETTVDIKNVKDVKKSSSYYKTMSIALNAGLVKPDSSNKLYPTKKATKKYVASVLAKVSESTTSEVLGTRNPKALLTKTTLKTMLNNIYPNVVTKSNAKIGKGNVMINKPVKLNNATITGNLVIGDGVADKEVTLDNVTVKGNVIVRGGGENSIIITGTSDISNIIVRQLNNKVSVKVLGDAKVSMVYVNDGSNDVNIVGQVGTLNVAGKNLTVTLTEAAVESLVVSANAKNAVVVADKDSVVQEATLNAKGTEVKGEGEVKTVNVNANNTIVTVKTETINTKKNVTPPITTDTDSDKPTTDDKDDVKDDVSEGKTEDSGNTSGGGSTGGGNSGGGTTETDSQYKTDKRFATGYPKVTLDKQSGSATVTYKLKDGVASTENPAKIYNIVSSVNTNWDVTTEAVIHGHLGEVTADNHQVVWTEYYDYMEIIDNNEYSVKYDLDTVGVNDGLAIYSVIDCNGVKSEVPTREMFDRDTSNSFVSNSISPEYGAWSNTEGTKLYIYYYTQLNSANVPDASCFTLMEDYGGKTLEDISVTNVSVTNVLRYQYEEYEDYRAYIELSLSKGLDQSAYLKYQVPEVGNKIQDMYGNPSDDFTCSISKVGMRDIGAVISDDGCYVHIDTAISNVQSNTMVSNGDIEIYINSQKISQEKISWRDYISGVEAFVRLDADCAVTSGSSIEVRAKEGKTLRNVAGEKLNDLVTTEFEREQTISLDAVTMDSSTGDMRVEISGVSDGESIYACNFVLKIGETEYRLRGLSSWDWSTSSDQKRTLIIKKSNLAGIPIPDNLTNVNMEFKYAPLPSKGGVSWGFQNNSGKPVAETDYKRVTIQ